MHVTSHSFPIDKRQSSDQKGLVWIIKLFWSSWRKFKDWIQIESKDSRILGMISVYINWIFVCWCTELMTYTWFYNLLHSLIYSASKCNKIGHNITQKTAKLLNNTNFGTRHWSFNLKIVWASKCWIPKTSKNSHYWLAAPLKFSCDKSRQPNY